MPTSTPNTSNKGNIKLETLPSVSHFSPCDRFEHDKSRLKHPASTFVDKWFLKKKLELQGIRIHLPPKNQLFQWYQEMLRLAALYLLHSAEL